VVWVPSKDPLDKPWLEYPTAKGINKWRNADNHLLANHEFEENDVQAIIAIKSGNFFRVIRWIFGNHNATHFETHRVTSPFSISLVLLQHEWFGSFVYSQDRSMHFHVIAGNVPLQCSFADYTILERCWCDETKQAAITWMLCAPFEGDVQRCRQVDWPGDIETQVDLASRQHNRQVYLVRS
jgi:hypothetical protein